MHNFIFPALVIFSYMTFWYFVAQLKARNDLADIIWGPGFVLTTAVCLICSENRSFISWLILTAVSAWAIRLSFYIFSRNKGKPEDFRYQKWREEWGKHVYWRSYLQVFLLQGFFMFVIGLPIWPSVSSDSDGKCVTLSIIGFLIWFVGFLIETIADLQMDRFRRQKIKQQSFLKKGLWNYSRHPNYFGECLLWWGIFMMCSSNFAPWWSAIGPATLTFLLTKVSGVPMLEKKYKNNKEYQSYKKTTSMFIPWFKLKS